MTSNETLEKPIVSPENGEGVSVDAVNDALEGAEKVSEIVGESASENMADGVKNGKKQSHDKEGSSSAMVASNAKDVVLPSVNVQRKKVAQVLMTERKVLLKQLKRIEKKKGFSAYQTETVITRLRKIQRLLSEVVVAAKERIEQLYRQYVLGK